MGEENTQKASERIASGRGKYWTRRNPLIPNKQKAHLGPGQNRDSIRRLRRCGKQSNQLSGYHQTSENLTSFFRNKKGQRKNSNFLWGLYGTPDSHFRQIPWWSWYLWPRSSPVNSWSQTMNMDKHQLIFIIATCVGKYSTSQCSRHWTRSNFVKGSGN